MANNDSMASADTALAGGNPRKKGFLSLLVRYGLPLALTVLLVWYIFKKVDFGEMMHIIDSGVDYGWILAAMGISVFSHIFRAARWRLQLRGMGVTPPMHALCVSIFGTYALNLLFPRLGEVWRCTYIAQREKTPLTGVLGSMVADRLSDTVMVLTLTVLTFIVAAPALNAFLTKYPVGQDIIDLAGNVWFWTGLAVAVAAVWWLAVALRGNKWVMRIKKICRELWQGFAVVGRMKGRGQFLLLTFAIWACYFLQLYVAFFAFPFTRELCGDAAQGYGLTPCLVAFVLSSIGMAIPSNGGLGPWNIAVMFGLAVYGITDAQGAAFSMLVWSAQTVMLIILGIYTMIYIAGGKKTNRSSQRDTND